MMQKAKNKVRILTHKSQSFALAVIFVFSLFSMGFGQIFPDLGGQRRGTSTAQFLKIEQGSRALGMGGAFVSIADDIEALYWNPAGITRFEDHSVFFSHTQWLAEVKLEYAGAVYHINSTNSLGLALTFLHTDQMKETTEFQPLGTGRTFGFSDFLIGLTYARQMTDKFSFGFTGKWMQENIAELTMRAMLFDLGIYYNTGWKTTRFGVVISNFGSDMAPAGKITYKNLDNKSVTVKSFQSFPPPIIFRIGLAADFLQKENHKLTGSLQLNHPNDDKENLNFGLEYELFKTLFLRCGYKTAQMEENLSFGFGLITKFSGTHFKLDYAYTNFGRLGYVNRFTAKIEF